jgi:hypothetical protein|tara:strand:+ start:676 stop:1041 length:366 start_codon:yes stop_codon:yes gene_type:complete
MNDEYKPHRGWGYNGNNLAGNGCQINFNELLVTIRIAYQDKLHELQDILRDMHWADTYEKHGYHHHTRGQKIEKLSHELMRLSRMLWMLEGMNGNAMRLRNFHWVFGYEEGTDGCFKEESE